LNEYKNFLFFRRVTQRGHKANAPNGYIILLRENGARMRSGFKMRLCLRLLMGAQPLRDDARLMAMPQKNALQIERPTGVLPKLCINTDYFYKR
jgi:hypothetical protein